MHEIVLEGIFDKLPLEHCVKLSNQPIVLVLTLITVNEQDEFFLFDRIIGI
jgi:hypothetical protein